jgi:enoyl-CoA hydratase/carnithine racemase
MDYDTIDVQTREDKIGIITLNRPDKRNALSIQLREDITRCLAAWAGDQAVSLVVFTGAGPTFSAGFDLKEFSQPDLLQEIFESSAVYHRKLWNFPKPTIAAINGPAMGGAFDLTTLCDIRICGTTAIFGHPEIKFGGPPLYTPLRWIIGSGLARDLCLTGRRIDAAEALRINLVSEVVAEGDDVLERGIAIGKTILEAPVEALKVVKGYLIGNPGKDFEDSFQAEHDQPFKAMLGLH